MSTKHYDKRVADPEGNLVNPSNATVSVGGSEVSESNPLPTKSINNSPIVVTVSESDLTPETYFIAIDPTVFNNMMIQVYANDATGASFKLYMTMDNTAAIPDTGGTVGATWEEITDNVFGGSVSGVGEIGTIGAIDTPWSPYMYLLEYTVQNATNTVKVWTKNY